MKNRLVEYWLPLIASLWLLFLSGLTVSYADVPLNIYNGKNSIKFSCDTLYAGEAGRSRSTARVFVVDLDKASGTNIPVTPLYQPASFDGLDSEPTATIALGPWGGGNGTLTMFNWYWGGNSITHYVKEGLNPVFTTLIPNPPKPGTTGYNYWSGGEVFQKTGEIYYSGGEDSTFRNHFRLMKYNPITAAYVNSGVIKPASESDKFLDGLYIASDMAIDGEGNVYLVVGNSTTNRHLVRVVVSEQTGNWTYNHVRTLTGGPGGTDIWGMAFLDGKLYLTAGGGQRDLYGFDTLTGQGARIGRLTNNQNYTGGHTGPANSYPNNEIYIIDDLAACQTAPVIKGTVYHDTKGEGNQQDFERLSGQKVEIWKATASGVRYYSTINTSGQGDFSFIVDDSRGSDYYVRFADPNIGGKTAVQSWANAGMYGPSSVVSQCINPITGDLEETNKAGACLGRYTDVSATQGDPTTWGVFQKISVRTDSEVPDASIALTTVANYGDAPASYGSPAHISPGVNGNNSLNIVHLGDTVSLQSGPQPSNDASRIVSHDGVEVANAGSNNYVPLQDMVFVSGVKYSFRVSVQGGGASRAYLNGWIDWSNGAATGSFNASSQIVKDQQLTAGDYIIFDYTVPSVAPVGVKPSFARFRISTQAGIDPVEVSTPVKKIDGEVEDYRVYFVPGDLSISAVTQGGVGSFNYTMTNISSDLPSKSNTEITVLREDQETFAGTRHAFSSVGQPVTITQYSASTNTAPFQLLSVSCKINGQEISGITVEDGERVTIPGNYIRGGSQISCQFVNSAGPRIELIKSIVDRDLASDQFEVQIKEGSTVVESATTAGSGLTATTGKITLKHDQKYTLTEIMSGSDNVRLGRYDGAIACINNTAGSNTVLPNGDGKNFEITPKNGDDITCTITNTPIKVSTTHSKISANPEVILADGTTTSTITLKLFKDNGEEVIVGGDKDKIKIFFKEQNHKGEIVDENSGVKDHNDGTYTVLVRSSEVADKEALTYSFDGVNAPDNANGVTHVSYVFGTPSAKTSTIEADPTSITADGIQESTLTVRLFDENGNQITSSRDQNGDLHKIKIIYVDENNKVEKSVLTSTTSPNDDGLFIAKVKSEKAGTDKFTFMVDTDLATGAQKEAEVTYVAGAPSAINSKITSSPPSILADGDMTSTLRVQLYDAQGNVITSDKDPETGQNYVIEILFVDASNAVDSNRRLTTTEYVANGIFAAKVDSKKVGKDEFTFKVGTELATDTSNPDAIAEVEYTAGKADSQSSKIKTDPKEIATDGTTFSTITVTLYDENGNPLTSGKDLNGTDYEVIVFSTKTAGEELGKLSEPNGKARNNGDGTFTITVTSEKKGREDFGFRVNTVESVGNTDHVNYLVGEFDPSNSTIDASPNPIFANGSEISTVIVQLKDSNQNNLDGTPGEVRITGIELAQQADQKPEGIYANPKGNGRYELPLTSVKAGTDKLGFTFTKTGETAKPGNDKEDLVYKPGDVTSNTSIIEVNPTSITANLSDEATITITLKDANENVVSPETAEAAKNRIALYFNDGKGPIGVPSTLEYVPGTATYTATIKSEVANDTDKILFTWDGTPASATRAANLDYVAGPVDPRKSTISASPLEIEADGKDASTITVQLKDKFGNDVVRPEKQYTVKVFHTNADKKGIIQPADGTMTPIGRGQFTVTVTSEIQGDDSFSFEIDTLGQADPNEFVTITYKMGGISASESKIWVEPKEISTNENDRATIYVQLMDAKGNKPTLNEHEVFISKDTPLKGQTILGSNLTDQFEHVADGKYKLEIYSEEIGQDKLEFKYRKTGATALIKGSQFDHVTYIAGDVDMTKSTIEISPGSIVADNSDRAQVTVQLRDKFGNRILKDMGEVKISTPLIGDLSTKDLGNILHHQANGVYTAYITSTEAGEDKEVRFKWANEASESTNFASIIYTAGQLNRDKTEISVHPSEITADEEDTAVVTIQFKDVFGNNLEGEVTGQISLDPFKYGKLKDTNLPQGARFMGKGKYEIDVISRQIGIDSLQAFLDADILAKGQKVDIEYIAGEATAENSEISVNPSIIEANDQEEAVLTVQLRDKFGNALNRETTKIITIDESTLVDGKLVGSNTFTYSGSNGRYVLSIKSDKVGEDFINFKLDGKAGSDSGKAHVKYEQGAVSLIASSLMVDPNQIIADGVDKSIVSVQLKDASGHDVDDGSKVITITGLNTQDAKVTTPLVHQSNGLYQGEITSTKSGMDTINYHIKDLGAGDDKQKKTITYVAGEYDEHASIIRIEPATIKADGEHTARVTVQLRDVYNNDIVEDVATVALLPLKHGVIKDGKSLELVHIGKGIYEGFIVSIVAGSEEVEFTVGGKTSNNKHHITYTPGDADLTQSVITADPPQIEADDFEKSIITVQLKDRYGNNVDRKQGEVYLTGFTKGTPDNDRAMFEHHGNGRYTIGIKSKEAGADTVSFRLEHNQAPANITAKVTYIAGKASVDNSTIRAVPPIITANGTERAQLIVQLRDSTGNSLTSSINQETGTDYVIRLVNAGDGSSKFNGEVDSLTLSPLDNGQFVTYVTSTIANVDHFSFTIEGQRAKSEADVTYRPGKVDPLASRIRPNPDSIEVSTGDIISTLTVELRDANNNIVAPGTDTVEIFSLNPTGTLSGTSAANTATVSSEKTGTEHFSFKLNGAHVDGTHQTSVRYTPGKYDLSKSTIDAKPDTIVADGKDKSVIVVQLKDGFGNNLTTNAVGEIRIIGVTKAQQVEHNPEPVATYKTAGLFELELTSTQAGQDALIKFKTSDGRIGDDHTSLTYLPGKVDLSQSVIYVDKTSIVANNSEESRITVELRDSRGNRLQSSQGTVKLTFNGGSGPVGIPTPDVADNIIDNNDGTYTATIKSKVANKTDNISFSLDEGDGRGAVNSGTTPAQVKYVAGEIDFERSVLTATPPVIEANGEEKSTITLQLRDAFGNDILTRAPTDDLSVTRVTNIGDLENGGKLVFDSNGRYTTTVTSKIAGTETFGYTIGGKDGIGPNSKVDITYQTGGISLVTSVLNVTPNEIVANNDATALVTVQLYDKELNKPTDNPGVVILTGVEKGTLKDGINGTFELQHVGNGLYQGSIISSEAGFDNIGFKFGATHAEARKAQSEKVLTYIAGEVDLTKSTIVINPASITANGEERATVVVQLLDEFYNKVTDNKGKVTLVMDIGKVNNSDSKVLTYQADGTYTGTITSTKAGHENVGFILEGHPKAADATAPITYTPGIMNLAASTITVHPDEIGANNSDISTITVQFKDIYGNNITAPIVGDVKLDIEGTITGIIVSDLKAETGDNGKYTATIKSETAGFDNIGFKVDANVGAGGKREKVTYLAGKADISKTRFTANPTSITANGTTTATLKVELFDSFGNKVDPTSQDDVKIIFKSGKTVLGELVEIGRGADGSFTAHAKSQTTGVAEFDFTLNGQEAHYPDVTVTYTAGAANARASEISAHPESITADGAMQSVITVQLRDQFGNKLTEGIGASAVTITHVGERTGDQYNNVATDNADGTYSITVTSKKAGYDTFEFRVLTSKGNMTATVDYTPGVASAAHSEISVSPSIITADGDATAIVTVILKDALGNRLKSDGGKTVNLVLLDNKGDIKEDFVYKGGDSGQFEAKVTSTVEGTEELTFNLGGEPATGPKRSTEITYRSGGYSLTTSKIELSKDTIIADEVDYSIVTVTLRDQYNNIVTDPHNVRLVGLEIGYLENEGSVVLHSANGDGIYTGKIASRKTGEDTLRFSVDADSNISHEFKVLTYKAGKASIAHSSITVNPSSITANYNQTATVSVQFRDKFGNNLDRQVVETVTLDKDSLKLGEVANTNGSLDMNYVGGGRYTIDVKSKKAGTDYLHYYLGTDRGDDPAALTYTAGVVSLENSTIIASPKEIVADGVTRSKVTVQFIDIYGNNLTTDAGRVTLYPLLKGELVDEMMQYVPGTGSYVGYIFSEKAGQDTLRYHIDKVGDGAQTEVVNYIPGVVDLDETEINATPALIKADGKEQSTITIQLRDAKGNIVPLAPEDAGTVTLLGLDNGEIFEEMTYQGGGLYVGKITSTVAASDKIGYQLSTQSKPGTNHVEVTYTPGDYDLASSTIDSDPKSIEANGVASSTITVQLKDIHGNNVLGNPTDVYATVLKYGDFNDKANYRFTPQGNGRYIGHVTSLKTGEDTIGFVAGGEEAKGITTKVSYFAGDMDPTISTITAVPKEILANGLVESLVTVQLKDSNGNNLTTGTNAKTNQSYVVVLKSRAGTPIGTIGPNANGEMINHHDGSFTATVTSTKPDTETFGFTVDAHTGALVEVITYTNGNGDFDQANSSIVTDPKEINADGKSTSTVTVTLVHKGTDQPLTGLTSGELRIIAKDKPMIGQLGAMSEAPGTGIYTFTMTSTQELGIDTLTFETNAGRYNGQDHIKYTAGDGNFDQESSTITADPTEIDADGVMTSTITVKMFYDQAGQKPIIGYDGLELVSKDQKAIVGDVVYVGESDGVYTFTVTSTKVGEDNFAFKTRAKTSDKSAIVKYTAGDGNFDQESSTITADPTEIDADGVMTSTITVKMFYDQAGQKPIIGYDGLELVSKDQKAIVGDVVYIGESDGVYTFTVTSTKVGEDNFAFKTKAKTSDKSAIVKYTAGDGNFDQESSTITADPTEIDADGVMTSTITVKMFYDQAGQKPIIGYDGLELVSKDQKAIVGDVVYVGESDGVYTFTVTSTKVGEDNFAFKTRAKTSDKSAIVKYTAGDGNFDQESSTITADPTEIDADGVMTSTITVKMFYDQAGQKPIIGYDGLELVSKDQKAIVGDVVYVGESDGVYTFTVTSTKVGEDNFAFKTRAKTSDKSAIVKYTAGDGNFDQESSTITADPTEIDADGVMTSTITVKMFYDQAGQKPIIGYDGLELVSKDQKAIVGDVVYVGESDGVYTFTVTSTKVGEDNFAFKTRAKTSDKSAIVKYTAGDGNFDQESSTITADPTEIDADGVMTSTITVKMFYDQAGQKPIIGYDGLELVSKDQKAIVGDVVYVGESDGVYTFTVTSTKVGEDNFAFKTRAKTSDKSAIVKYTAGDGNFDQESSTITADPTEIDADGVMTSTITVKMFYDQAGQKPIIGYDGLELVSKDQKAIVGDVVYVGESDGVYTFTVTSTKVGEDNFAFKTRAKTSDKSAIVKYTAGDGNFDQESSTITADPTEIDADGIMTSTITVKMFYDQAGQKPIIGYDGLELVSKDQKAIVGDVVYIGESDGVYTFTVTSTKVGEDNFAFKTRAKTSDKSAIVKYTAGDGNFDQESSTITADPTEIDADGIMTSTITVKMFYDQAGQKPIIGYDGLELVSKDQKAIVGDVVYVGESDGVYTFTVTSTKVGEDNFAFKTRAKTSDKSAIVKYTAGDGNFDQESSTITADPTEIDADGIMTSTITVKMFYDQAGQKPIIGYDGLELVSKDQKAIVGDVVYVGESDGVYTFTVTSTKVGEDNFAFKTRAKTSDKSAIVKYTAGDGNFDQESSTITADPTEIDADGVMTSTITVKMFYDQAGQKPIIGYDGLELVSKDQKAIVGDVVYVGESDGVYTFTVTSTKVGEDNFAFKTRAKTSDKSAIVKYTAGDGNFDQESSTITADPTEIDADGIMTSTITVKMFYDQAGQKPIIGYDGLELVSKDQKAIVGDVVYIGESDGVYTFTVTSTKVGEDNFAFKTRAKTSDKSAIVKYTAGDGNFDQESSTITADPTEIDADGIMTSTITVKMFYDQAGQKPIIGYDGLELVSKDQKAIVGDVVYVGESDGVYTFTVTSTKVGEDNFAFKTRAKTSDKSAIVKYTAGDGNFDQESSTITADPTEIDADGIMTSTITVKMFYDQAGQKPIIGYDGLELVSKDQKAIVGDVVYVGESDGVYTFTVTSTKVGEDNFAFKTRAKTSDKSAIVKYTAGDGNFDQESSTITADPTEIDADGIMTSTITVKMFYDQAGQKPIIGYDGLELVSKDQKAIVGDVVYVGESDGVYTFTVTSTKVGEDNFAFKTRAKTSDKSAIVKYTAGDGNFDQESSTITADPIEIDADGIMTSTITVKMFYDQAGQKPIIGYDGLELVSKDQKAIVGDVVYVGESNGVYTFTVTSTKVGEDNFAFKTKAKMSDKSAIVKYVAGSTFDEDKSSIIANPEVIDADGVEQSKVTVKLFYKNGLPIEGHTAQTLSLITEGAQVGIVKAAGVFESAPGVYEFEVTSLVEGKEAWKFKTDAQTSLKKADIEYLHTEDALLLIRLSTSNAQVKVGDVVMVTANVKNIGNVPADPFNVINSLPGGFSYVANSAKAESNGGMSITGNSPLDLGSLKLLAGEEINIRFVVRVGAGIRPGNNTLYAEAFMKKLVNTKAVEERTISISNRASVVLNVDDSDPLFDDSLIIGTVYHDRNGNGMQDPGEPGIPGVRIASAEGLIITTDQYGRYHLKDIKGGKWERGRNYILKIDVASLPEGVTFVTPNPLVRRITPGLPTRFDFALQLPEESILEVSEVMFVKNKARMKPEYEQHLAQMVEMIEEYAIKEITITTWELGTLSEEREEYLQKLLNSKLNDENQIIVGSESQEVEGN